MFFYSLCFETEGLANLNTKSSLVTVFSIHYKLPSVLTTHKRDSMISSEQTGLNLSSWFFFSHKPPYFHVIWEEYFLTFCSQPTSLPVRNVAEQHLMLQYLQQNILNDKSSARLRFFFFFCCGLWSALTSMQWRNLYIETEKSEQTVFAQIFLSQY